MVYFQYPKDDVNQDRQKLWNDVIENQLLDWSVEWQKRIGVLSHHIEAKALYVFTMSRRFVRSLHKIGGNNPEHWRRFYPETYLLLFPSIELFGKAVYPVSSSPKPDERLETGFIWLNAPSQRPHIGQTSQRVQDLISIRNYLLHGVSGHSGEPMKMDSLEPHRIAIQLEKSMRQYWQLLKQDSSGTDGWVERLSCADIKPFPIPGSKVFEKCLLDPDIIEYLDNVEKSVFPQNRS